MTPSQSLPSQPSPNCCSLSLTGENADRINHPQVPQISHSPPYRRASASFSSYSLHPQSFHHPQVQDRPSANASKRPQGQKHENRTSPTGHPHPHHQLHASSTSLFSNHTLLPQVAVSSVMARRSATTILPGSRHIKMFQCSTLTEKDHIKRKTKRQCHLALLFIVYETLQEWTASVTTSNLLIREENEDIINSDIPPMTRTFFLGYSMFNVVRQSEECSSKSALSTACP